MNKKILIGIPTYKREKLLEELLDSLLSSDTDRQDFDFLVADNCEVKSALRVCEKYKEVFYVSNPLGGLAEIRNTILDFAKDNDYEKLYMIDDDERGDLKGIKKMSLFMDDFGADLVSGPVIPVYRDNTPRWVKKSRIFEQDKKETGEVLKFAETNNLLLNKTVLDKNLYFNKKYNKTGGEDMDFTHNLYKDNFLILWFSDYEVTEKVHFDRMNYKWVFNRGRQIGNAYAKIVNEKTSQKALSSFSKSVFSLFNILKPNKKYESLLAIKHLGYTVGLVRGMMNFRGPNNYKEKE